MSGNVHRFAAESWQNSNRLNGVERNLNNIYSSPNGHQNDLRLYSERIHRSLAWNAGIGPVPAGIRGNRNDVDEEYGEDYWRNRAYQAEHSAAAVSDEPERQYCNTRVEWVRSAINVYIIKPGPLFSCSFWYDGTLPTVLEFLKWSTAELRPDRNELKLAGGGGAPKAAGSPADSG